jgi:WD40 repeat protein
VWAISAASCILLRTLVGHTDCVSYLAVLPNDLLASGSGDGTVRVWNTTNGVCVHVLTHAAHVCALLALPSGNLVSASYDSTVLVWDTTTGACLFTLEHYNFVKALAVLPDGRLVSGCGSGSVTVWDLVSGSGTPLGFVQRRAAFKAGLCGGTRLTFERFYSVFSLVVLSDDIIVLGPSNSPMRVLDLASGECILTLNDECYRYSILAVLPNGNLVATTNRTTVCVLE